MKNKRNVQRLEGRSKADGKAKYGADVRVPDMAHAVGVSLGVCSARIDTLHLEKALKSPGILGIFTAEDIPGKIGYGLFADDEPIFVADTLRMAGDVVALVVAETKAQAEYAAGLVTADLTMLPTVLSIEEALNGKTEVNPAFAGNICSDVSLRHGNADKAIHEAEVVVDATYDTAIVEHAYIEPEVMTVIPLENGRLEIKGATQHPFYIKQVVCDALDIPDDMVVVRPDTLGASFGGKVEISAAMAARAAVATKKLNRPVQYVLSRKESITQSHKRHGISSHVRLGASADGILTTLIVDAVMDAGAYINESPIVSWKTVNCGPGPYRIPNVSYRNRGIMTNNIVCGAMRGFGTPQAIFALENAINELAAKLQLSPLELRKKNLLKQGDETASGQKLTEHAVSMEEVLNVVAEKLDFENKFLTYSQTQEGHLKRGVGIGCSIRGVSFGADSVDLGRARIRLEKDGRFRLYCPMMEMGQGAETVLTQICAEALGMPIEKVSRESPETDRSPDTGAAGASRGTFIGGNAILDCVHKLKDNISDIYGSDVAELEDQTVFLKNGKTLSWEEVRAEMNRKGISADFDGEYLVPPQTWDEGNCQGNAFVSYVYSCHGAEVEVNVETGQVKVLRMVGCHDAGRIINPVAAEGQVTGGMAMGIGQALTEEIECRGPYGTISNDNFDRYLIPTSMDVGKLEVYFIEHPDDSGPLGAKSLGEPAMEPTPAAVIAAINHALGNSGAIRTMPANLEVVQKAALRFNQ